MPEFSFFHRTPEAICSRSAQKPFRLIADNFQTSVNFFGGDGGETHSEEVFWFSVVKEDVPWLNQDASLLEPDCKLLGIETTRTCEPKGGAASCVSKRK